MRKLSRAWIAYTVDQRCEETNRSPRGPKYGPRSGPLRYGAETIAMFEYGDFRLAD